MKNILIIYFLFCISFELFAQGNELVFCSVGNDVYVLDTTSVKRLSNIITCRVNILQMKMDKIHLVSKIIRQYLLNSAEQKFYILGQIEYDSTFKVINRNESKVVNPKISEDIKTDSIAVALAKYLNIFLKENIFDLKKNKDKANEIRILDETSDSSKIANSDSLVLKDLIEEDLPNNVEANLGLIDSTLTNTNLFSFEAQSSKIIPETYDYENEINSEGTIFTDGKLYCFQVSSWKNLSKAEREVNNLINKGFNAFIVRVNLGGKKGVWYRVRIGYFNSLDEARENQKKVSL